MSEVAEQARLILLADKARQRSDSAVARAERLGARLQAIYDAGDEPSEAFVDEYLAACRRAEVTLLERAMIMSQGTDEP